MKAIRQYTDGDLVGTMNTNDSSAASDPFVFKMGRLPISAPDNGHNARFRVAALNCNKKVRLS